MDVAENREIVLRFYEEVWNKGNYSVAREVFADDYVRHDLRAASVPTGPEGQAAIAERFRAGFSEFQFVVDLVVAEGEMVVARWTATGVHSAEWNGVAATGRPIRYTGVNIFRLRDGKVVEIWNHRDDLGLLEQLGVSAKDAASGTVMYGRDDQ